MQRCARILGVLLAGSIAVAAPPGNKSHEGLQSDEYAAIALIYNDEIGILGDRAIYPICISLPAGNSTKAVLRYLHQYGFPVSDSQICNPPLKHGDFPHGMEIEIRKLRHESKGRLDIEVGLADNTIHVGEHFTTLLRHGNYHFKQSEKEKWEITGYTKIFDYRDAKEKP